MASASSRITNLHPRTDREGEKKGSSNSKRKHQKYTPYLNNVRVPANVFIWSLTTLMPRSSEAFNYVSREQQATVKTRAQQAVAAAAVMKV
jgi:hypothetical protein